MSLSGPRGNHKITQQKMLIGHTLQQGTYVVETVLGHGGMGHVFLASHVQADIPVAIKQVRADEPLPPCVIEELDYLLHQQGEPVTPTQGDFPLSGGPNTDRFLREALLMARLHHPALPLLYDYFLENGYWYLVMEYVPGPTLAVYMREHTPLPQLEAINYALQICDVLQYLHTQNPPVIFRDLKPTNIILHPDGRLMVVDFGIARYFKEGQFNDTADFGSPGYASPEQYDGLGQTDARSDLFSLGVILHEMLSGQHPTQRGVAREQLESLHKLNPGISPALSGLVVVATRTEPMYRFQSAHTFYQALERVRAVEERRAYRYHTLMAEASAMQKTPAFPFLIPPPSSQGFLSDDLAHGHDQRAQQVRIHELPHHSTPRTNPEQEVLTPQVSSSDTSLKLQALSLSLTQQTPQHDAPPIMHLNNPCVTVACSHVPNSPTVPRIPSSLPPIPQKFTYPLPPHKPNRLHRLGLLLLSLSLLFLLVFSSLLASSYIAPTPNQAPPQLMHTPAPQVRQAPLPPTINPASPTPTQIPSTRWQNLPALPFVAADNTAIYVQNQQQAFIYLTGGFRGTSFSPSYSQGLYRYALARATWEKVDVAHFPSMGNNATAQDEQGNLFFTGGYAPDSGTISAHLYQYQPVSNTLHKLIVPLSFPLGFGGSMLADQHGHLYLNEGFLIPGNPAIQAGSGWYRYDIASGLWHMLAPLPLALGYVQLVRDNLGNILLVGGSLDAGQRQPALHIYRYNVRHNTWTQLADTLPSPLSGAASCADGQGHLILVGGYDPVHNQTLPTVQQLNLATLTWQTLPPLPNGGSWLGTASCDGHGHVYITRGANNPTQPTSDFLELTLARTE